MALATTPASVSDFEVVLGQADGFLNNSGCIRNATEVPKLLTLMKDSDNMFKKCLMLNILQATKANSSLTRFMESGGWSLLNSWLLDAKKSSNGPLMVEILMVLQKLPVTIAFLKQGNLGKLVKQLSKNDDESVKTLASDILTKWMAIFREGQAARTTKSNGEKIEGGPMSDSADSKKEKKKSKKDKELKSPVEAQPPPGPLVALGKPRDKLSKRPRDLINKGGTSPNEKRTRLLSEDDDKTKNAKGPTESLSFMDALSTQAAKWHEKRIKKIKIGAKQSPTQIKAPMELGADGETTCTTDENGPEHSEQKPSESTEANSSFQQSFTEDNSMEIDESRTNEKTGSKKKKVSWATEDTLVSVHYFEMDESERSNVSRSFLDAAHQEKLMEREALAGRVYGELVETIPWVKPFLVDEIVELIVKGKDSQQKAVQMEREQRVLGQLFLNKASVPPTPTEPDPEDHEESKPTIIPLYEPGTVETPPPFYPPSNQPQFPPPPSTDGYYYNDANLSPPQSGPPPPHGGPPPHASPPHGGPPHSGPPQGVPNRMGPPNEGDFGYGYNQPPGGNYPYYPEGQGSYRSGWRGGRGRGRGRGKFNKGMPNICKHFITHGCRLGNACKFMHIAPEDLSLKMSQDQPVSGESPPHSNA